MNLRENEHVRYTEQMAALEAEVARMREEMAQQMQEYQNLMDIKVVLDLEIAEYRKLLESEEARWANRVTVFNSVIVFVVLMCFPKFQIKHHTYTGSQHLHVHQ